LEFGAWFLAGRMGALDDQTKDFQRRELRYGNVEL
jgi:hypothetical protein